MLVPLASGISDVSHCRNSRSFLLESKKLNPVKPKLQSFLMPICEVIVPLYFFLYRLALFPKGTLEHVKQQSIKKTWVWLPQTNQYIPCFPKIMHPGDMFMYQHLDQKHECWMSKKKKRWWWTGFPFEIMVTIWRCTLGIVQIFTQRKRWKCSQTQNITVCITGHTLPHPGPAACKGIDKKVVQN